MGKRNSYEVCGGWRSGEEEEKEGASGEEGCVWRLVRMLINLPPEYLWPESLFFSVFVIEYHSRSESKRKGL